MNFYDSLGVALPEPNQEAVFIKETDVNIDILNKIALGNYPEIYDETKQALLKYINHYQTKNQTFKYYRKEKTGGYGRLYCEGAFGMQNLWHCIRNAGCREGMVDVDIKNCYPTLLKQIAERMMWDCEKLNYYTENRDAVLQDTIKECKLERAQAKNLFISGLMGGTIKGFKKENKIEFEETQFIKEYFEEMKNILNLHYNTDAIGNDIANQQEEKQYKEASAISYTLQIEEDRILRTMLNFFKSQGLDVQVLCFDGCQVKKNDKINDELLKKLSRYVKLRTSWEVEFVLKDMNEDYFIPYEIDTQDYLNSNFMNSLKEYNLQKEYFEKYCFKLIHPQHFILKRGSSVEMIRDEKALNHILGGVYHWYYEEDKKGNMVPKKEKFLNRWKEDVLCRQFQGIDSFPPPLICPPEYYNLFNGYRIENVKVKESKKSTEIFYKHMRSITGNDEECYQYFLKYLAYMLKYPAERPEVALIFRSKQGTGKSMFFDWVGHKILGSSLYLTTAKLDQIVGRFSALREQILITVEETSGEDTFGNSNLLKDLITSQTLRVEKKNFDIYEIKNNSHFVFLTNNTFPVKIEGSDRRFVVFECSEENIGNHTYFEGLADAMKDDELTKKFFEELINIDLQDFVPRKNRPITEAYKDIQAVAKPKQEQFIEYEVQEIAKDGLKSATYTASQIYDEYKKWCEKNGFNNTQSCNAFALTIKNYKQVSRVRSNGTKYVLTAQKNIKENFFSDMK